MRSPHRSFALIAGLLVLATGRLGAQPKRLTLVYSAFPPFEYTENGKAKGLSVEILQAAFDRMGYSVTFQEYPWKRALHMVETGEADGAFSANRTREREAYALFPKESLASGSVSFFALAGEPIAWNGSLESLGGFRIGIDRGSSYGDAYDEAVRSGTIRVLESNSTDLSFRALLAHRIDLYLVDEYVAWHEARLQGATRRIRRLSPPFSPSIPAYLMFTRRKDLQPVVQAFDAAMGVLRKNGTLHRILVRYTG
jgi:polar amino acid transport system substrate-binding protein